MAVKDFRDGYMAALERVLGGVPVPLCDLNREYIEHLIRGVEAWDRA